MEPTKRSVGMWTPPPGTPIYLPDPVRVQTPIGDDTGEEPGLLPSGFVEWFVVAQTAIPAALYLPGSQAYRLPIRIGAYAITLVACGLWWFDRGGKRGAKRHPAERWLLFVLLDLSVMVFNPLTNSLLSGIAQIVLYVAIFCAVFWSPAFINKPEQLVRILALFLVCNGINSFVGILQVYNPDRFMPQLSFAFGKNTEALAASMFVGPGGRMLIRPPGLFDTPGAVCGPGTVAALLGLIFALEPLSWWKRLGAAVLGFAGMSAVYLSHVRANFVILLGMMLVYGLILAWRGQKTKAVAFGGACFLLVTLGLTASVFVGGEGIRDRFVTLLADDPRTVYYNNRGQGMSEGFAELAADYPFGAGLARWGMMRTYFGNAQNLDSTELFAEVQPNAWMLDGGFVLVGLYSIALIVTLIYEWRVLDSMRDPEHLAWVAAIVAANMGTMAMVFSFVPFGTQMGLQFWFLEGALHGAMVGRVRR